MRCRIFVPTTYLAVLLASSTVSAQSPNPDREAYFGETHIHTGWSFDAYIFGNTKTTPADAYKYAIGEPIKHALGYDIKIETPLDWMGVTDHSEYVGVVALANTPGSSISKLPIAQAAHREGSRGHPARLSLPRTSMIENKPIQELVASCSHEQRVEAEQRDRRPVQQARQVHGLLRLRVDLDPEQHEHAPQRLLQGLPRQVPPMPFSSFDSQHPEDLWNWMDGQRKAGHEVLAISHNANLSDGHMYPIDVDSKGRPIDAAWAASRDRNERLIEIKQMKGQSETHPLLSPTDEFANYEIMTLLLGTRRPHGDDPGKLPAPGPEGRDRHAGDEGYNPYKTGIVGGSDSHNSGSPYRQDNFYGGHELNDGTAEQRMSGHLFTGLDLRLVNPAGLTGVWAEQNTRASIFDAHAAQGDLRDERTPHQGPVLRRLGLRQGTRRSEGLGQNGLREGRAHGRRPAAGRLRRRRPSRSGPSRIRPRATSTGSRSSRDGRRAARASRRSTTSPGRATGSPTSGPARSRRSATRSTSTTRRTRTRSAPWS